MDYEKKYKEALERAKTLYENTNVMTPKEWAEQVFSEFKESGEDEKIRKQITYAIKELPVCDETKRKCIAWLEKQGEHTNRVEPNFKAGEWCINKQDGTILQIKKVLRSTYKYITNTGEENYCAHCCLEQDVHLWTIKDAKDGDVLAVENRPFIYNGKVNPLSVGGYCGITNTGLFKIHEERLGYGTKGWAMFDADIHPATKEQRNQLEKAMADAGYVFDFEKKELKEIEQKPADKVFLDFKKGDILYEQDTMSILLVYERNGNWLLTFCDYWIPEEKLHVEFPYERYGFVREMSLVPATKEQCDLLFQKMHEAGYEWDANKKELKKIEQVSDWSEDDEQYLLVCKNALAKYQTTDKWDAHIISNWLENRFKERLQPKQEWSEEDEKTYVSILNDLRQNVIPDEEDISWLKSLKNRVQPVTKQEWSEEDENWFNEVWRCVSKEYPLANSYIFQWLKNRLKSLRPQNRWKPSEEQIQALVYVFNHYIPNATDKIAWNALQTIELMLGQLLRGE